MSDEAVLLKLRTSLEQSRRDGLAFADAWDEACRVAKRGLHRDAREVWGRALGGTEYSWRAAYNGTPALPCETVVTMLLEATGESH